MKAEILKKRKKMRELLIINAKTIQHDSISILMKDGKITKVADKLKRDDSIETIDLEDKYYVSPGWIDIHTHCYPKWELYYDDADQIGYKTGVTTVIDAGSCGYNQIDDFYEMTKHKLTNVYAFINIADTGIFRQDELSNLSNISLAHCKESIQNYPNFIVGLKARMSASVVGNNGIKPLITAMEIKKETRKPLMVHCGSFPPRLKDIANMLGEDCMLTHCFHGKENGIFNKNGEVKAEIIKAVERGMYLDVGHGKESFSFDIAKKALEKGIKADTISSDIYQYNRMHGPVYHLSNVVNKMWYIGYSLEETIDKITKVPNDFLKLNKGYIKKGYDADLTIFSIVEEEIVLKDSIGKEVILDKGIKPHAVVLNNSFIKL